MIVRALAAALPLVAGGCGSDTSADGTGTESSADGGTKGTTGGVGDGWTITVIDPAVGARNERVSITLDPISGEPVIAYGGMSPGGPDPFELRLARGPGFSIETIDANPDRGYDAGVRFAPDGTLWIVVGDDRGVTSWHETAGAGFEQEIIENLGSGWGALELEIDEVGLHVCAQDVEGSGTQINEQVVYFFDPFELGVSGSDEQIDGDGAESCRVAVDPSGQAQLAYLQRVGLRQAFWGTRSSGWEMEAINPDVLTNAPAMALDAAGDPIIIATIVVDPLGSWELARFRRSAGPGSSWQRSTLWGLPGDGDAEPVLRTRGDAEHLIWEERADGVTTLRYARGESGTWTASAIAQAEGENFHADLAVGDDGSVHVAWWSFLDDAVSYARRD